MPPVNILIKPVSSACNMSCTYCFYRDVSAKRSCAYTGALSLERMEQIIVSAMAYAQGDCTFAFQGGEPTLAGLDFYREVLLLEQRHRRPSVQIHNTIQTNGLCIDEAWARFFAENDFLVGLSLDGPPELHDRNRRGADGGGTCRQVLRTAQLFDRFQVPYNILCVVTGQNARSIQRIYNFYKKQHFQWLQFIPCLEPLDQEPGLEAYHLSCEAYGDFLIRIFDLWLQDLRRGVYVSVRHLDNWLSILLGEPPEACNMTGHCSVQYVIEGDGGIYPCDFYVLDQWRLGTVGQSSFAEMQRCETARRFVDVSLQVPEQCRTCPIYPICRNGCRRDRLGPSGQNRFCGAYRRFFEERARELEEATALILRMRQQQ